MYGYICMSIRLILNKPKDLTFKHLVYQFNISRTPNKAFVIFASMKNLIKSTALLFVFILCAQYAFAIRAYFDYRVFHVPGQGPYVEFITSFDASSFKKAAVESGKLRASAELTLIVSQNDQVKDFRKVTVDGPEVSATETGDFMSLERFSLPNGEYEIEITIQDLNDPNARPEKLIQPIVVNNLNEGAFISDISFVSAYSATTESTAFTKSGYDIIPYISSYFPSDLKAMMFYAEVYNTDKVLGENEPFGLFILIKDKQGKDIQNISRVKKNNAKSVLPQFHTIDISALPSGDYRLLLEVRDRNNTLVCMKERAFSRNLLKPLTVDEQLIDEKTVLNSFASRYTHADSLRDILRGHLPIAKSQERITIDNVIPTADLLQLQSFFYTFWYKRDQVAPEAAWREYEKQLNEVNKIFATRIKKGWETDRGRVYLQYGPPNTRIMRPHDPDYWPFEIWHYYETNDNLHDRRFLFYNTTLGPDYELLHSDVPMEPRNFDWPNLVRQRSMNTPSNVNRNANVQDRNNFSGDELQDLWYNPY